MIISALSIPAPTLDASTVAGQTQWFLYGFGYASSIAAIALAIRLFKKADGGGTFEN